MSRPVVLASLLASCLFPAGARAQSAIESQSGPPYASITLTQADLGSWDAELTGRAPWGARVTVRGIETNTVGCNGACIVTRVEGELAQATRRRGGPPSTSHMTAAARPDLEHQQTGMRAIPSASSSDVQQHPVSETRPQAAPSLPRMRTSVEYPDADHRIATVFAIAADGRETQTARIVYTRRK